MHSSPSGVTVEGTSQDGRFTFLAGRKREIRCAVSAVPVEYPNDAWYATGSDVDCIFDAAEIVSSAVLRRVGVAGRGAADVDCDKEVEASPDVPEAGRKMPLSDLSDWIDENDELRGIGALPESGCRLSRVARSGLEDVRVDVGVEGEVCCSESPTHPDPRAASRLMTGGAIGG